MSADMYCTVFLWGIRCATSEFSPCSSFLSKLWSANSSHFGVPELLAPFPQSRESIWFCLGSLPCCGLESLFRQLVGQHKGAPCLFSLRDYFLSFPDVLKDFVPYILFSFQTESILSSCSLILARSRNFH